MLDAMRLTRVLPWVIVMLLAACGGGGNDDDDPTPPPGPGPDSGLDQRPNNTSCVAPDRNAGGTLDLDVERMFPNLTFTQPVGMLQAPGDDSRWFVIEKGGTVHVFDNDPAVAASSVFVQIAVTTGGGNDERGLLGMAFHPGWPTTNRVFVSYTAGGSNLELRIAELSSPDGGLTLDPNSLDVLMHIGKDEGNHNGGNIAFGPDGFLYIGTGDGGGGNDQHGTFGNGQRRSILLGKMLRIDVNGTTGTFGYRIPAGNAFSASNAFCGDGGMSPSDQDCPEIYAYGLRNPWRWSFDRQTGELWVGDVGQSALEEIDRIVAGGNYGWRCREGTNVTGNSCPSGLTFLPPVAQYGRSEGFSVTGGYVYRGTAIPNLEGRYVFGDFGTGQIWDIASDTQPTLTVTSGFDSGLQISSFGEGVDGEIYVVDYGGTLHHLTASGGGGTGVATQLSDTGCVNAANPTQPASGLIPYAPSAAFWSDGATKERWIGLPNGQNITVGSDGDWTFPSGSVLVKNFRLGNQLVETRLFMRHPDGVWAGYSYEWNAQQTDATLVVGGKQASVGGQTWIFPSEAQCLQCHTAAAGRTLGLENRQLAFEINYPQTGRTAHQLVTLNEIDTLSPPVANPEGVAAYPDPAGNAPLAERARSYLHTNCSQCHRPGGSPSAMDLRFETALAQTNACDVAPSSGDLGITDARLIAPGDAARSVLIARMNRRDANGMPPVGSAMVDAAGVALLTDWVNSLASCN